MSIRQKALFAIAFLGLFSTWMFGSDAQQYGTLDRFSPAVCSIGNDTCLAFYDIKNDTLLDVPGTVPNMDYSFLDANNIVKVEEYGAAPIGNFFIDPSTKQRYHLEPGISVSPLGNDYYVLAYPMGNPGDIDADNVVVSVFCLNWLGDLDFLMNSRDHMLRSLHGNIHHVCVFPEGKNKFGVVYDSGKIKEIFFKDGFTVDTTTGAVKSPKGGRISICYGANPSARYIPDGSGNIILVYEDDLKSKLHAEIINSAGGVVESLPDFNPEGKSPCIAPGIEDTETGTYSYIVYFWTPDDNRLCYTTLVYSKQKGLTWPNTVIFADPNGNTGQFPDICKVNNYDMRYLEVHQNPSGDATYYNTFARQRPMCNLLEIINNAYTGPDPLSNLVGLDFTLVTTPATKLPPGKTVIPFTQITYDDAGHATLGTGDYTSEFSCLLVGIDIVYGVFPLGRLHVTFKLDYDNVWQVDQAYVDTTSAPSKYRRIWDVSAKIDQQSFMGIDGLTITLA